MGQPRTITESVTDCQFYLRSEAQVITLVQIKKSLIVIGLTTGHISTLRWSLPMPPSSEKSATSTRVSSASINIDCTMSFFGTLHLHHVLYWVSSRFLEFCNNIMVLRKSTHIPSNFLWGTLFFNVSLFFSAHLCSSKTQLFVDAAFVPSPSDNSLWTSPVCINSFL